MLIQHRNAALLPKSRLSVICALVAATAAVIFAPGVLCAQKPEPSAQERAYRERVARNPQDVEALAGMATLQAQRGDYTEAIASYRALLKITPADHDAKVGLARALAFDGQYDAALQTYQELLKLRADDTDALEGMGRVEMWSGHMPAALAIFLDLASHYPANPDYGVALARVQMNLQHYSEARKTLTTLLAAHPGNRDAQIELADLDLEEGRQESALRRYNQVIKKNPTDIEALEGNARVAYYRGDLAYAHNLAAKIVADNPRDVSALLLLADIERAMHRTKQANALAARAQAIEPHNGDVRELEDSLRLDAEPSLHTAASYSREIGTGSPTAAEDLTSFGYETTWGFYTLPRSDAYLSLNYLPSQVPNGGIGGAAGPSQILYRQTFYATPQITVRAGVGMVRFGPGGLVTVPSQTQQITSAGIRPLGFASISYTQSKRFTLDVTGARAAITYTPTADRLGVVDERLSVGFNYRLDSKTDARFEPYADNAESISYPHTVLGGVSTFNQVDHDRGGGASLSLTRKLFQQPAFKLDVGYDGLLYGFTNQSTIPYLGFFNPGFYQRHYFTTHLVAKLHGPVGLDFSSGTGIQQIDHSTPIKAALLFSPALTFKVSRRFSLRLGYTYYDSAQSLGTLRGNAVQVSTDTRF